MGSSFWADPSSRPDLAIEDPLLWGTLKRAMGYASTYPSVRGRALRGLERSRRPKRSSREWLIGSAGRKRVRPFTR
jgi:hypothetical protein